MSFLIPGESYAGPLPALAADEQAMAAQLRAHVDMLATTIGPRNIRDHLAALRQSESWIESTFRDLGHEPRRQEFSADGQAVRNIDVEIRGTTRPDEIFVIGAHYDSVTNCPAANDNGSGIAGTIEMARYFTARPPAQTMRFVAFVNEEPPYFHTEQMGSLVYARVCRARNENIAGMISLETIGYYSDAPGSQHYPAPFSAFFPKVGNFIGFCGSWSSRHLVRGVTESFRRHTQFPSEGLAAPDWIPGIGWSDHWSFSKVGYPALMATDTAPYRYMHYHTPQDTPEKLDYEKMARVLTGISRVVEDLAKSSPGSLAV
ncbi:MAG TPA: M28 family peptidase [Bryobacteraceae bacterium]|jgi:Zn-dependent M28 family amino/carboxypeptidase